METIAFLVAFPVLVAGLLLIIRSNKARTVIVSIAVPAIMLASIWLAINHLLGESFYAPLHSDIITIVTLVVDVACSLYVIIMGVRHKHMFAVFLAGIQVLIVVVFELVVAHNVPIAIDLYIDSFSVIMALIIGIIGGGICLYSLGYMQDHQSHQPPGTPDRRHVFFALMFLFLSAMYVIVFSNNLAWLFCAWEVTTVCSFALIGYTRTEEAITNSFRQIVMNLVGGLAFAVALVLLGTLPTPILELDKLIQLGAAGMVGLPIMLLALAAFTKAAQMPFHSWLLGAMVAPTPTSALLHSSTMVKAGVFLLIKLSPCLGFNINGIMVVLVGGFTFLVCSALAVSQSNAKRVLAYSTIANLGLIVACSGIGTPDAVWAAVFLLVFHAVAKSLLFLTVGTAEHHIHSRDIEEMDNLFERMPQLARLMALGIVVMFIAPFGMLVSKWATMAAIMQTNNLALMLILAFGSAVTFMFWSKWLGKVLAVAQGTENLEKVVHCSEWTALTLMAVLIAAITALFPWISRDVVVPYLARFENEVFNGLNAAWQTVASTIDFNYLLIMTAIAVVLGVVIAIRFLRPGKGSGDIYLSGVGMDFKQRTYRNSFSQEVTATQRNWYLGTLFGEQTLEPVAIVVCSILIIGGFVADLTMMGGLL